jgi:rSAM/selenodomain-associated transferase 1
LDKKTDKKSKQIILVFLRAPEKGKVKTRLARDIGDTKALALYKTFVKLILLAVKNSGIEHRICFFPEDRLSLLSDWLGMDHIYYPQSGDDLGQRMENTLVHAFDQGAEKAVLVGSDIPDIRPHHFLEAFDLLEQKNMVIGPSLDGGYWLIGFQKNGFCPDLFRHMIWGTDTVFADTIEKCRSAGLSSGILPSLRDIDTLADLLEFQKNTSSLPHNPAKPDKKI